MEKFILYVKHILYVSIVVNRIFSKTESLVDMSRHSIMLKEDTKKLLDMLQLQEAAYRGRKLSHDDFVVILIDCFKDYKRYGEKKKVK